MDRGISSGLGSMNSLTGRCYTTLLFGGILILLYSGLFIFI